MVTMNEEALVFTDAEKKQLADLAEQERICIGLREQQGAMHYKFIADIRKKWEAIEETARKRNSKIG